MSAGAWLLLVLRIAHALAAMIWLGGGVYLLLVVGPVARTMDRPSRDFMSATSVRFREIAQLTTLVMLSTGVILAVDRLSSGDDGLRYAALLAIKVAAAIVAFWLAGVRPARRVLQTRGTRRATPEIIVALGLLAFVLGVALASVYGSGT